MAGEYTKLVVWTRDTLSFGTAGVSTPGVPVEVVGSQQIWMTLASPQARSYARIDCYVGGKTPETIWTSDGDGWKKDVKEKDADKLVEQVKVDYADAVKARAEQDAADAEQDAKHLEAAAGRRRKEK